MFNNDRAFFRSGRQAENSTPAESSHCLFQIWKFLFCRHRRRRRCRQCVTRKSWKIDALLTNSIWMTIFCNSLNICLFGLFLIFAAKSWSFVLGAAPLTRETLSLLTLSPNSNNITNLVKGQSTQGLRSGGRTKSQLPKVLLAVSYRVLFLLFFCSSWGIIATACTY